MEITTHADVGHVSPIGQLTALTMITDDLATVEWSTTFIDRKPYVRLIFTYRKPFKIHVRYVRCKNPESGWLWACKHFAHYRPVVVGL